MKKSVLGFLCLILVLSCDIPQSVTVKGNPGLYLYLGSPFSSLGEGERLEDYISTAKIKEMMGDQENIKIYDYQPPGSGQNDVHTFVVHYPIAEMSYDLSEYVDDIFSDDVRVQPFDIHPFVNNLSDGTYYLTREGIGYQYTEPTTPLFVVPLDDMAKLIIEVNGTAFGIELNWSQSFKDKLRLKIPAFGMNDYTEGAQVGNKLRFVNSTFTQFKPEGLNANGEIEIFALVLGGCSGTILPESVFEWDTAKIDVSGENDDKMSGEYSIGNILGDFLGEGVSFKEVKGYIYVDGIDDDKAALTLKNENIDLVTPGTLLKEKSRPSFPDNDTDPVAALPAHSVTFAGALGKDYIDLAGISTLNYKINVSEMTIENDSESVGKAITIDLVILLPLELIVKTPSSVSGYVKLDLGDDILPKFDEDLFGRTGDELIDGVKLKSITILVRPLQNEVIGNPIAVRIVSGTVREKIDLDFDMKEISSPPIELPFPFTPSFEILLKEDSPGRGATLSIKRQDPNNPPVFDFIMAIEARTDLDIKL